MAYTASNRMSTVFGNKRVVGLIISCDAASGAIDTGVTVIHHFEVSPQSAATASPSVKMNQNSAGTALNGSLFFKSAAAGDNFVVTVYGQA